MAMRVLYHFPLCPFSRKVRLALLEKKLDFTTEQEPFWERRELFVKLNPAGQVPTMIDLNGNIFADSMAICEYLDDAYPEKLLIGDSLLARAEVRRLVYWFDGKTAGESTLQLLFEKVIKRNISSLRNQSPNIASIRGAKAALRPHLEYISWLCDRRNWLAGTEFSLADITAAAHLSVIDYFGDVPWDEHEGAKSWYMRVKSRASFRPLLQDTIANLKPADHYTELDF